MVVAAKVGTKNQGRQLNNVHGQEYRYANPEGNIEARFSKLNVSNVATWQWIITLSLTSSQKKIYNTTFGYFVVK